MALYPNTGSILTRPDGGNRTGTGLSTSIIIKVGATPVGAVQTLSVRETRPIQMISEVGTDGNIDSAPRASTEVSGTCRRVRYDRLRVTEAFGRDFLHAHSQRIAFDIDIYDNWVGDGANSIITTIKNVWCTNLSYEYSSDNFIIYDSMDWVAETVYSQLNGGPAATGGERGAGILQVNSIERAADIGNRRGSLDAPGLLLDFFSNV